jgi:hypothetical protein
MYSNDAFKQASYDYSNVLPHRSSGQKTSTNSTENLLKKIKLISHPFLFTLFNTQCEVGGAGWGGECRGCVPEHCVTRAPTARAAHSRRMPQCQ